MENVKGVRTKNSAKDSFPVLCRILRETNADRCPETHEILLGCAQKNDDMNRPDVFVIEVFGVTVFDALVLAKQKVCRVTGSAFAGKAVADFLYLDIGDASIFKFDDDVGDQKRRFDGDAGSVIWQNF